jgi:hypothetical protein
MAADCATSVSLFLNPGFVSNQGIFVTASMEACEAPPHRFANSEFLAPFLR